MKYNYRKVVVIIQGNYDNSQLLGPKKAVKYSIIP